jgi:hypothetical protein
MQKTEKSVVWILFAGKPEKFPASQLLSGIFNGCYKANMK